MPAKPIEQKIREGNAGKRKLPEPLAVIPALEAIPEPPDDLEEPGRAFWADVYSVAQAFISPHLDRAMVEWSARLFDECARYRELLARGPLIKEPITTASGGVVGERFVPNPAAGLLRQAEKALLANLVQLSIPPAARARLGLIQVRAASELQQLAERQTKTTELHYDDDDDDAIEVGIVE